MSSPKGLVSSLIRLYSCIKPARRTNLYLLVVMTVVAALCEVFSIGALFPLLSVMIQPEIALKNPYFGPALYYIENNFFNELLFSITTLFSCAVVISAMIRFAVLKFTSDIAYGIGGELNADIFNKTLLQPYLTHVVRNSSQIIDGLTTKNTALIECVRCCINILSSLILLIIIGAALIIFEPLITGIVLVIIGLIYTLISKKTKPIFTKNGALISEKTVTIVQEIQESIGSIREIIINKNSDFYTEIYRNTVSKVMQARSQNNYIGGAPKYAIEASGMVLMAILAYYFFTIGERGQSIIPLLGVVALASQRLLPILQQLYSNWSDLLAQHASLNMALDLLEQKIPSKNKSNKSIKFDRSIILKEISFQYAENQRPALQRLNLVIKKGERIAIIGPTGGGKSTLLDIIMAVIYPKSGSLRVDDISITSDNADQWHDCIAHVPQNVFLVDKSIAENIAFGMHLDQIDMARVKHVAEQAKLSESIAHMANGYMTRVGERGMQLSGGQRQRVAIARALYRNAAIIILDEATSALDNQTEFEVMETVRNIDKKITIIMVTHREKAIKDFDSIYLLKDGRLTNLDVSNY
jgi:ABC-type bacteriocin/lantibiotic exporter with double-glycine peptidase domain